MAEPPDDAMDLVRAERDRALADLESATRAYEAELQHRVRNALAVVRSVFSRTIDNADTIEHAADHFRGRLDRLAHFQIGASSRGFELQEMIYDSLMVYAVMDDPRIEIAGPEVRLNGRTAETIGLALHELVTNSIKFGMLAPSYERGALHISWSVTAGLLSFEWLETGIAIVSTAPLRSGFGREYIEQALPYQIGGESCFELSPGRLRCEFSVPLSQAIN